MPMTNTYVMFDPTQSAGSKFPSAAVQAEIGLLGSVDIPNGSITSAMLANGAVDTVALAAGAVTTPTLASAAVTAAKLATGAVTSGALAAGAVTTPAAGPGIPTAATVLGAALSLALVPLAAADYAALGSPNPNTLYFTY
jgi:hypothetical protein